MLRAIKYDEPIAFIHYGIMLLENDKIMEARNLFLYAKERGYEAVASLFLGKIFERGLPNFKPFYGQALEYFSVAHKMGIPLDR